MVVVVVEVYLTETNLLLLCRTGDLAKAPVTPTVVDAARSKCGTQLGMFARPWWWEHTRSFSGKVETSSAWVPGSL